MPVFKGRAADGSALFIPDDPDCVETFEIELRLNTDVQNFEREFGDVLSGPNSDVVREAILALDRSPAGAGPELSVSDYALAVGMVLRARRTRLLPIAQEPTIAENRAAVRDDRGRFASAEQARQAQEVQEFESFSRDHSVKDCRERTKTDARYAEWYRQCREVEMNPGVPDAVQNLNEKRPQPGSKVSQELREFAMAYGRMSAEEIRKARRADFSPHTFAEFVRKTDACIAAGLI